MIVLNTSFVTGVWILCIFFSDGYDSLCDCTNLHGLLCLLAACGVSYSWTGEVTPGRLQGQEKSLKIYKYTNSIYCNSYTTMQCIKKYQNQKVIITVLEKSSLSTVDINVLASVAEELLVLIATD